MSDVRWGAIFGNKKIVNTTIHGIKFYNYKNIYNIKL